MRFRRRLPALLLAVAVFAAALVATAQPASAAGDILVIKNIGSGLCLEVALGEEWDNGAAVQQNTCIPNEPRQLWRRFPAPDSHWSLINQANNKCLDVRDGRDADRTVVQLWDCAAYDGMYWWFGVDRNSFVRSAIGRRCLDVTSGSLEPGAKLQTYRCTNGNTAQYFLLF
jgi:hypothetical protein